MIINRLHHMCMCIYDYDYIYICVYYIVDSHCCYQSHADIPFDFPRMIIAWTARDQKPKPPSGGGWDGLKINRIPRGTKCQKTFG